MNEFTLKQIKHRITCSYCSENYKKPKLLPCQHSFCSRPCLASLVDSTGRKIECYECHSIHAIPVQGIDAFPNNTNAIRLLDFNTSKSIQIDADLTTLKCSNCNQDNQLLMKCLECENNFCLNCKKGHLNKLKNEARQLIVSIKANEGSYSQKVGKYSFKLQKFQTLNLIVIN